MKKLGEEKFTRSLVKNRLKLMQLSDKKTEERKHHLP